MNDIAIDDTEHDGASFTLGFSCSATPSVKTSLSRYFLIAASSATIECKKHQRLLSDKGRFDETINEKIVTKSATSIILSVTYLESYINSFITNNEKIQSILLESKLHILTKIMHAKISDKYAYVLSHAKTEIEPSPNDVSTLITFRNYLSHYKPIFIPHPTTHMDKKSLDIYKTLHSKNFQHPYQDLLGFPKGYLCFDSAMWAVKTAINKIRELCSCYNIQQEDYITEIGRELETHGTT